MKTWPLFLLFVTFGFSSEQTIFITGIAGFIGFHTAVEAKERNYSVVGVDNFNDYYDVQLKRARADILREKGIEVIIADICDQPQMEKLLNERNFDAIIHLAGQAGVRACLDAPQSYIDSNIVGTWVLLELNKTRKVPMILASSSSVYGGEGPFPTAETNPTDAPLSLYAATKKAAEAMSYSYYSMYGMPITCLRFFSVYGPWGRPDMAYYLFTRKILQGDPISVFGKGELLRDVTYVDDVVSGIFLSLERIEGFHIYNLGCSEPHTINEILSQIETKLGVAAMRIEAEKPSADAGTTYADTSKAERELGYCPKVFLSEGIDKFIDWLREYEPELFQKKTGDSL